jgi:hypothetical protein
LQASARAATDGRRPPSGETRDADVSERTCTTDADVSERTCGNGRASAPLEGRLGSKGALMRAFTYKRKEGKC